MELTTADRADIRRLVQELRTQNVLTIATILSPDLFKEDADEATLENATKKALTFLSWIHKSIQQSIE